MAGSSRPTSSWSASGSTPRIELAEAAGLNIDNGVVVDELLQTSAPGIFAAGDIANAWHPHYQQRIRIEHWANALNQGAAAGANASGEPKPYTRLPYFFSDQYDLGLEYVGYASADDSVVIRGDLGKREFIAFYHRDGIVTAGMNVNVWDVVEDIRAIITAGKPVDPAKLADPDVPLANWRPSGRWLPAARPRRRAPAKAWGFGVPSDITLMMRVKTSAPTRKFADRHEDVSTQAAFVDRDVADADRASRVLA